ncbi:MAG: glycoside hydrolase family 127 protein [Prevotellaceae bacterium]|jgi:hypothetical protein|nr:glycoside hydrolase family 127 protein [Prevotellaceae bacterium]
MKKKSKVSLLRGLKSAAGSLAVSLLLALLVIPEGMAQSGVYVGGHIRRERPGTITKLKESGFQYVILFNVHVEEDGTLTTDGETICRDGKYVFAEKQPHYVSDIKSLKNQPTSIKRIEICIGGWGNTSYENIKKIHSANGLGSSGTLYKNFKALKDAIPEIDAVNNDDEHTYDVSSAAAFHLMMDEIGYKTTLAPYTRKDFWTNLVSEINKVRTGVVERVLVQCYGGGGGNNPADWHIAGIPLHAGRENYQDFQETQTLMQDWKTNKNVTGGFFWVYNDETWDLKKYATAVNKIFTSYVRNKQPLTETPFIALPIGAVRAEGWLLKQLQLQKEGLTGHAESLYNNKNDLGADNDWLGGTGDSWERAPYYTKGLVALAYVLNDDELKAKAQKWIDWSLNNQQGNGNFGPAGNTDWWARMPMLYAIRDYYEATGDARVIPFLTKYFQYQNSTIGSNRLSSWGKSRAGDNIEIVFWLYNRTGDAFLMELADKLKNQAYSWTEIFTNNLFNQFGTDFQPKHNVNIPQAMKTPAIYYQKSQSQADRDAYVCGRSHLLHDHGQPHGMQSGNEMLGGKSSLTGLELCSVVEQMQSSETAQMILGDASIGDQLEKVAFNALPGGLTSDIKGLQYYQQANQVISKHGNYFFAQAYDNGNMPGPYSGFGCCRFDFHMGWPYFVKTLWAATSDDGLAAMAYSPSSVTALVSDGVRVTIAENTSYPFDEKIELKLTTPEEVSFPLKLRIPEWCKAPVVKVNGAVQSGVNPGSFYAITRTWKNNDVVTLDFPMSVEVNEEVSGSVSIQRGPLVYSLKIGESWTVHNGNDYGNGFRECEVTPTTEWNYALIIDKNNPEASIRVNKKAMPADANPYEQSATPVTLTVSARKLPSWKYSHNGRIATDPPFTAEDADSKTEEVTLVPYGAETLRATCLPYISSNKLINTSFTEDFAKGQQGWIQYGGSFYVKDGAYFAGNWTAGHPCSKSVYPATSFSDFAYSVKVQVGNDGGGSNGGVMFRASRLSFGPDEYSGYYVGISSTDGKVELGKADGSWTSLKSASMSVQANRWYKLCVVAKGANIKVYVDDMETPKIDVNDASFASGVVGVRSYSALTAWDDIKVTALAETDPAEPPAEKTWTNPLTLNGEWDKYGIGDPYILKYRGVYYLYSSTRDNMVGVKCWATKDFITWSDAYTCTAEDITKTAYAPEVVYWNGKFYMYTSPDGKGHYILQSDSPTGPFVSITGNIGREIDGSVFIDDDGKWYFYHASNDGIKGCAMSSPTSIGSAVNLNAKTGYGWTEGPCVVKRNGTYYLFYTGNHVISKGYRIDYAKNTDGAIKPYTPSAQNPILISSEGSFTGLGHGSAFIGPDLDSYYFTYHNLAGDYGVGPYRRLNFDRIAWNDEKLLMLGPTTWPQQSFPLAAADYFDRNELGEKWTTPDGGSWGITGKDFFFLNALNDSSKTVFTTTTMAANDYTAEFTVREETKNGSAARLGAVFSYSSEQSYGVALLNSADNRLEVRFRVNGAWTATQSFALPTGFIYTAWHSLRIEKRRGSYSFFVDGMKKATLASSLSGGRVGYMAVRCKGNFSYIAMSDKVNGSSIYDIYKPVPGIIAAVHYNTGGNGVGYYSASPGSFGDVAAEAFRGDSVSVERNAAGGYHIRSSAGEWYRYSVNVESAGAYNMDVRYAAADTCRLRIFKGETAITGAISLPPTGGAGAWHTLTLKGLNLDAGYQTLKVETLAGSLGFYEMKLVHAGNEEVVKTDNFDAGFSHEWSYVDGSWRIESGQAVIDGVGKRTLGNAGWSDYAVEVDITCVKNMNGGLIFRVNNPALGGAGNDPGLGTDYLQGYYVSLGGDGVTLGKHNYNWKHLKTASGSYSLNVKYHVKVVAHGANIKVYVQDMSTPVIDYTDTDPFMSGKVGLRVCCDTHVRFDNFSVSASATTVPEPDPSTDPEQPTEPEQPTDPGQTAVAQQEEDSGRIYPNPVHDILNVIREHPATQIGGIYSIFGHLKKSPYPYAEAVDVSDLAAGIYIIELTTGSHRKGYVFIKK